MPFVSLSLLLFPLRHRQTRRQVPEPGRFERRTGRRPGGCHQCHEVHLPQLRGEGGYEGVRRAHSSTEAEGQVSDEAGPHRQQRLIWSHPPRRGRRRAGPYTQMAEVNASEHA